MSRWPRDNSIWPIRNDCVMMEGRHGGEGDSTLALHVVRSRCSFTVLCAIMQNIFTSLFFFFFFFFFCLACYCFWTVVCCALRVVLNLWPQRGSSVLICNVAFRIESRKIYELHLIGPQSAKTFFKGSNLPELTHTVHFLIPLYQKCANSR